MYGALLNPYHPLACGLVGCWLFNEGGGNIVYDFSGHGNHGTLGGGTAGYCPSWVVGKFGSALDFDGSNDYVDCGDLNNEPISDITISLWFKRADVTRDEKIIDKMNSVLTDGWVLQLTNQSLYWYIDSASSNIYKTNLGWSNDEWHHVVITKVYSDSYSKLYIDGIEVSVSHYLDRANNTLDSSQSLSIGARPSGSDASYFDGTIALVCIWNRVLSAKEISQLYTDPFCMFYHPVLQAELLYAAAPPAGIVPQAMHHYRMMREV